MMQQPEPLWQLNPSAYLEQHEVKPTANRISILKQLVQATHPLSLRDLEELLDTIDLIAFTMHGLKGENVNE